MLKENIMQFIDLTKEFILQNNDSLVFKKNKHIARSIIEKPSLQIEKTASLPIKELQPPPSLEEKKAPLENKKWINLLKKYVPKDTVKEMIPRAKKAPILLLATAQNLQEKVFIKLLSHAIFSKMCRLEVQIIKNSSLMPLIEKERLLLITEDLVKKVPEGARYLVIDYSEEKRALWNKIENFIALPLLS